MVSLPYTVVNGLAVYRFGAGEPVLFMPYPHAASVIGDPVPSSIIKHLLALKREVVTFDAPNSGRSTRAMNLSFAEMMNCAEEALAACDVSTPVDLVGHSQGAFAALVFALEQPARVKRLILVGGAASGASYLNAPGALWNCSHPDFWKLAALGVLYLVTRCLAAQNLMFNLIERVSYVRPKREARSQVRLTDWFRPAFPRTRWAEYARHQDYRARLKEVSAPTLVVVGRHDPQCPLACSEELARGLPDSRLVIFERSGHYPFVEEPEKFVGVLATFFEDTRPGLETRQCGPRSACPATG